MNEKKNPEFQELAVRIEAAGLMDRTYVHYVVTGGIAVLFLALSLTIVTLAPQLLWVQILNAFMFAFFSSQIGIIGHDLSHGMVFDSPKLNRFFASMAWSVFSGLSELRWYRMHNEHHKAPNHIGHDPDLRIPFMFSEGQVNVEHPVPFMRIIRRTILPVQHLLFFPALSLVYLNYIRMVFTYHIGSFSWRGMVEMLIVTLHFVALFWFLFTFLPTITAIIFLVIVFGTISFYMSILFAPNHKGCNELDENEQFTWKHQIVNTRNLHHPPFLAYVMGGLDYQIEHHLFPKMSRARLPQASKIVKDFCAEYSIPYHEVTFKESCREMYRALKTQAIAARN